MKTWMPLSNKAVLEIAALACLVLVTLSATVYFCWNEFWSPVTGVVHLSISGAVALAVQFFLAFVLIWALRESK